MGKPTIAPSQDELKMAEIGIAIQLEAANVIVTPELNIFLDNQIQVIAHYIAWTRYLNNLLAKS